MEKQNKKIVGKSAVRKPFRWVLVLGIVIAGAVAITLLGGLFGSSDDSGTEAKFFTVSRGDLTISVTESGGIMALNSEDIKSEVEGRTTIINIVDEGTYITPEDVANGKILVELDSSNIQERENQQEITFYGAEASHTEARESLDIQKKQNDSDIQAAEMNVRFTLMDLKKYLGEILAGKLVRLTQNPEAEYRSITSIIEDPNNDPNLGGEALQRLRELHADITLTEARFEIAYDKWQWTQKLAAKKYVSENELKGDELDVKNLEIQKERSRTAKALFLRYEFPKEAERLLSDYHEANRELERTLARTRSKLAQAKAQLASREATYRLQDERLQKLRKQLAASVIRAPSPGEVVYSSSTDRHRRYSSSSNAIEVGAEVYERQKIISIPDTSEMKVEIKIHETWIDKVQPDQEAKITIAAFPDRIFEGKVLKKAPLADPEQWMNPDLKVYTTDVSIVGTHESLKTGMTGKVEIIIDQLQDVLSVPIQTVISHGPRKICHVVSGGGAKPREVETGTFNDSFVEIKSGLSEGEKVLLNPPRLSESEASKINRRGRGRGRERREPQKQ